MNYYDAKILIVDDQEPNALLLKKNTSVKKICRYRCSFGF